MQNAPFHIFTHNTHFGHHPRLLYMRLRRLFFSAIIQCFSLGLSMGSAVCFSHNTIRALVFGADSPTDEMKRGRMVMLFTSRSWDSLLKTSGTRHSWSAWLCCIAQVWLPWCSQTYLIYNSSLSIYFHKEFTKQWRNAHSGIFQSLQSGVVFAENVPALKNKLKQVMWQGQEQHYFLVENCNET